MKHGYRSGEKRDRPSVYRVWIDMVRRCHNPQHKAYRWYGAKGVAVCQEWRASFEAFLSDMGERPDGMTLDRIDVRRGYEPSNCRWATQQEQQRNRSNNKLTASDAAEIRRLKALGERTAVLAGKFGVCDRLIRAIVRGEKWA